MLSDYNPITLSKYLITTTIYYQVLFRFQYSVKFLMFKLQLSQLIKFTGYN